MHRVQLAERELRDLGMVWRTIEAAAAISCPTEVAPILPTLIGTRERFEALQARLIRQMAEENRDSLGDELQAQAQCTIDILVRNLYERTADVGFLATDPQVRAFFDLGADAREARRPALRAWLAEYQAKYTVYDDVLLLAPDGQVLARLDERPGPARSNDPVVAQALAQHGHVERFGPSDLQAEGDRAALLYAHRVANRHGLPAGVLVLRFRFADEMQRIFDSLVDSRQELALVLLDEQQRVVATNDEAHVPLGARLRPVDGDGVRMTTFAGREYLAVCCGGRPYQGYSGPAWRVQAMVSMLTAFRQAPTEQDRAQGHLVPRDHPALMAIVRDADEINRDLRRVVWNGQLMAGHIDGDALRLKAVLAQINQASVRTRRRLGEAIDELAHTALSRARRQSQALARLAADIVDRNLYERANDCRWWALSPALRQPLAEPPSAAGRGALNTVLDQLNALYTVYSRVVVFDTEGRIRGASHADAAPAVLDEAVPAGWLPSVQALQDSQRFAVTGFDDCPLHAAGPTYTYLAAIRAEDGRQLLGGIALVFNAARELPAMLGDVFGRRGGFALFTDAHGQVLASSHAERSQGFDMQALAQAGDTPERAGLMAQDGVYYACANVPTPGYREFRQGLHRDNGMRAVVALQLGTVERRQQAYSDQELGSALPPRGTGRSVAVFQVGAGRYTLPVAALLQAVSRHGLVPTPDRLGTTLGLLAVQRAQGDDTLVPVVCGRRLFGVHYPSRAGDGVVLVLRDPTRPEQPLMGLWVDDVLTVLDLDPARLHAAPDGTHHYAPWLEGLFDATARLRDGTQEVLLQSLDPLHLLAGLGAPGVAALQAPAHNLAENLAHTQPDTDAAWR